MIQSQIHHLNHVIDQYQLIKKNDIDIKSQINNINTEIKSKEIAIANISSKLVAIKNFDSKSYLFNKQKLQNTIDEQLKQLEQNEKNHKLLTAQLKKLQS